MGRDDQLRNKQKSLKMDLEEFQDTKAMYAEIMNDVDEQIEVWDALREKLEDGKSVYPPRPEPSKKRKAVSKEKSRKKQRRIRTSDDEDTDSDFKDYSDVEEDDGDEGSDPAEDESQQDDPLTEEQIASKLHELKSTRKDARTQKLELTDIFHAQGESRG